MYTTFAANLWRVMISDTARRRLPRRRWLPRCHAPGGSLAVLFYLERFPGIYDADAASACVMWSPSAGAASYAVLGIIMAVAGVEQNLTDNGSLWGYCVVIGAVRSFYENTSKMLVVEFLDDAPALVNRAMAAMYFHNGSASTITFLCLLIPANPYRGIGYAMVGFGLLIGAGFLRLRSLKDTETGYTLLA